MCNVIHITRLQYDELVGLPGVKVINKNHLFYQDPINPLFGARFWFAVKDTVVRELRNKLLRVLIQDLGLEEGKEHAFLYEGKVPGLGDEHYVIKRSELKKDAER